MDELRKKIAEGKLQRNRAKKLLDSLAGEKQKWTVCNRMVEGQFRALEADSLLGAALTVYLAQFSFKFR